MLELHDLLGVDGPKIYQDDELYTFTVDSILLANFVNVKPSTKKIVDLGTGTSPIPLYLSLRTKANIIGIEIQQSLYELAKKSVKINMKDEQINLICDDMRNIFNYVNERSIDCVVCNPPFFKVNETSNLNPNVCKQIARHEVNITLEEIIIIASRLLKHNGVFALVHRPDRLTDIIFLLRKYNLEPKRIRFVYPRENSNANQVLVEAMASNRHDGLKILEPLYIHPTDSCKKDEINNIYNGVFKE